MPGARGVEKIEIRPGEARAEAAKEIDVKVAPFIRPLPDTTSALPGRKSEGNKGLDSFIAIGEQAREITNIPTNPSRLEGKPTGPRSFTEIFRRAFDFILQGGVGGFGGPLMLFSFLLRPGSEKVSDPMEYSKALEHYNDLLRNYDEALRRNRAGIPMTHEQQDLISHPTTLEIARRRQEFVRDNSAYHSLVSADRADHPLYLNLQTHFDPNLPGSVFRFGPTEVFSDPAALIRFSEWFLEKTYRGEVQAGDKDYAVLRTSDDAEIGVHVEFLKTDGSSTGTSEPGGRVVIHFTFEQPIGLDGIGELKSGQAVSYGARGGLQGAIPVMDGVKTPTQEMYVIGGPRGEPIGSFDLLDIIPGRYRPNQASHAPFWREHALLSGREGITRKVGNSWLDRRPGYEVPMDRLGNRYSLVPFQGKDSDPVPEGSRIIQVDYKDDFPYGYSIEGKAQHVIRFRDLKNKQKIELHLAKNQSGHLGDVENRFLLIPLQKSSNLYGFYREDALPLVPKVRDVEAIPEPIAEKSGFFARIFRRKGSQTPKPIGETEGLSPLPADTIKMETAAPLKPYREDGERNGDYVRSLDELHRDLRIYVAGQEPLEFYQTKSSIFSLDAPAAKSENYSFVGDVRLLTHNLSGERQVRLSFVYQRQDQKGLTMMPTGAVTMKVEDAVKLGIVAQDSAGKLFVNPKHRKFFVVEHQI